MKPRTPVYRRHKLLAIRKVMAGAMDFERQSLSAPTTDGQPLRRLMLNLCSLSPLRLSAERKQTPQIVENSSKRMEL